MRKLEIKPGDRFGRLMAVEPVANKWKFVCDCGGFWATTQEQAANRRNSIRVEAFGKKGCLADFLSPYAYQYKQAQVLIGAGVEAEIALVQVCGIHC